MRIKKQQNKNRGSRFIKSYSIFLKRSPEYSKGFTLIELMVATVVFTSIMLASMGSLFVTLNAAKNSKAMRLAMDNVNFAMESMTRSIRMGTYYYCVSYGDPMPDDLTSYQDCSTGGTLVAFVPQETYSSDRIGYKLKDRQDGSGTHSLQRCDSDSNSCVDIVSSAVDIEKLLFFVNGSDPSDSTQASVYIIMKGTVTVKGVPTSFAIQTMASQRNF